VTRTWPVAGVLFGILWVFVQGPPLAPEPLVGSLLIGLAVGFPTAFVFRRLYEDNMELRRSLRGVPYVLLYVLTFIRGDRSSPVSTSRIACSRSLARLNPR